MAVPILLVFLLICLSLISGLRLKKNCYTEDYEEHKVLLNCAHTFMPNVNFTDTDSGMKSVVYMLDVSSNNISAFTDNAFSEFTSLNILILSKNQLSDAGSVRFVGLKKLEVLDLSFNKLQYFSWGFLQDLPQLKILDVSNNYIRAISPPPEKQLLLEKFLISHNPTSSIQNIPVTIKCLDLSYTDSSAEDLQHLGLFKNLVYLKLEQLLNLNETQKRTFSELENLEEISFRNCVNLVRLDEETFSKANKRLRWVDLSHCGLTTLPKKLEPVFLNLHWLDLRGNRWSCDKRIHWMWRLHISPTLAVPEFRCLNPPSLKNMPSSSFLATRVHLHSVHSKMLAGVWLIIIIGATIVVVFMVKRRLNKVKLDMNTKEYSVRRYSRLKESFENI